MGVIFSSMMVVVGILSALIQFLLFSTTFGIVWAMYAVAA